MIKVLFVCLGNICRSPTAHGVFQHLVDGRGLGDQVFVDSAGTGAWHIGNPPDARSQQVAEKRHYDLSTLRARKVEARDFDEFDYVLAMDDQNLSDLKQLCPPDYQGVLCLFLDYTEMEEIEVPDPYYGGDAGFEHVLDLVESASEGLLREIEKRL